MRLSKHQVSPITTMTITMDDVMTALDGMMEISETDKLVRNTMTMTWSKWLWRHNVFLYSILVPGLEFVIKKLHRRCCVSIPIYHRLWDTMYRIRELAETLHISSFRFSFCQLVSEYRGPTFLQKGKSEMQHQLYLSHWSFRFRCCYGENE